MYPPNQQLNYLTQTNILTKIPNNPYTVDDITSTGKNITDWNYSNINGEITLFAYTHPDIIITLIKYLVFLMFKRIELRE